MYFLDTDARKMSSYKNYGDSISLSLVHNSHVLDFSSNRNSINVYRLYRFGQCQQLVLTRHYVGVCFR